MVGRASDRLYCTQGGGARNDRWRGWGEDGRTGGEVHSKDAQAVNRCSHTCQLAQQSTTETQRRETARDTASGVWSCHECVEARTTLPSLNASRRSSTSSRSASSSNRAASASQAASFAANRAVRMSVLRFSYLDSSCRNHSGGVKLSKN
jgi:hypothetical protein